MFFQINVTPEARRPPKLSTDYSEPQSVLVLAPFQPQTHINLETTVNSSASTTLLIKNPGNRQLDVKVSKLPPDERKILLNPWTVSIPSESQAELTISWTPKEAGSWRDTLQLIDSRRIKHDIAIITTATQAKKIQTKTKTRILAPTNDNNVQQTFNHNQQSLSSLKCQENKENNCQKRSERKHFDISSKPTEISGIFDISSYQLTPIKNDKNRVTSTITSDIKFSPGNGITSPNNNHEYQLRRETFVHPNIHHELPSPFDDSDVDPRRETYDNPNPKFCKYKCTIKEVEEEIYDDDYRSHSPEPTTFKATHSDFSMMIDNLANFVTPIKTNRLSINACSTGQKSDTDKSIGNTTFEINSCDVVATNNETFEYDKSPIRPTSINLQPNKLVDNFGKISPVKGMDSLIIPATPISSSPVSRYQYGENVSVRDVLEADLWVKNQDTAYHQQQQQQQQASSSVFRSKCNNLDKIIEEQVTFTTQTFTRTLNYSTSNQSAFCFEISPTKRVNIKKSMSIKRSSSTSTATSTSIKRISPKKTLKINKEKSILQHSVIKKKSIVNNSIRKSPGGGCTIPPVRIKKLSLAGLNKTVVKPQKKETIVKMYDPNDFIFHNPDPFAATMTEDPFLASTLYYDEKWIFQQEMEFKKWLNELLTPPEHLNTDIDTVKIDIAKVWQSSRLKDNITLAETKEAVSARYHTNTRLNTLRKAALAIFTRPEVRKVLSSTAGLVERGIFVIRQDRDLNRDIGLQKIILELLLSYNPLWLRIGLEVIYGETIPLNSNNDLIGLTKFLLTRFFNDPFIQQKHSHPLTTLKLSSFLPNLNKFIVKKFLLFVYFVDYAKNNKLIGHDPCLFHKKATYKESREILLTFSRETLSGVGDITKILRTHGYIVTQKQTYIDEYDYAVKDLSVDLRDGVRLCRVMELITGLKTLTCRCRVPAISRLQKIHNAELALTALRDSGYIIAGHIDAKAVADGHREKTLSLLWQIIYKFQAPRFSKSAMIIQKWWRSKLWYIKIRNFLKNRKLNAAIVIQCSWRSFKARQLMKTLKNQRQTEIIKKNNAAKIIQTCWRQRKIMLKLRHEFLDTQKAVVVIQKWFRRLRITRPYCQQLEAKKNAIVTIQKHWRATRIMLIEQKKYNNVLKAVNLIQLWWRNASASKRQFNNYKKLKTTVLFVQSRWRANKSMKITKSLYMKKQKATNIIQRWWRSVAQMKKIRNNFVIQKSAARIIASWWIRVKLLESQRNEFLTVKKNIIVIQRAWRRHHETKNHVLYFKKVYNSSVVIQTWWRCVKIQNDYKQKKNSAIVIQSWFRAIINQQIAQKNYNSLKKAVVIIQKNWRMKLSKKKYSSMRESALKIQRWYRNIKKSKSIRLDYLAMKKSAVCIQSWWRCLKKTWYYRSKYLEIKNATMVIQSHWRAELLSRKESQEYQRIKMFIIKFQSQLRMVQVQRSYLEKLKRHKAAIIIQRKWRAYKIGTEIKNYYNKQRSAVIIIQRKYRATIAAREAKKTYQHILEIIIKTQRKWRAKKIGKQIQENYIKIHNAILIIQRKYRATVKAREVRNEYLKLHEIVVNLQNRWRANKLCKQEQMNYQNIRKSCICLQANWKMLLARRQFVKQKNAAIIIQQKYRATKLASQVQKDYKLLQQLTIKLQRIWRAKKVGKLVLNNYIQQRKACIVIQKNWRMIVAKRAYEKQKLAVVFIQRKYRATIEARESRQSFLDLRDAVVKIQRKWRAKIIAKKCHQEYQQLCHASICLQSQWRMIKAQRNYNKIKKSVIIIQNYWRTFLISRQTRAHYLALKKSTINIQQHYRAKLTGQKIRKNYIKFYASIISIQQHIRVKLHKEKYEKAASVIQNWWRLKKLTKKCQNDFTLKQKSIIIIQQRYRAYKIAKKIHNDYNNLKKSVIKIQILWRYIYKKKCQNELLKKHKYAVLKIENWWLNIRQLDNIEKQKLKKIIKSVILIQSVWRGYKIRKIESPIIAKLRERSKKATELAKPSSSVENKLRDAMIVLQNYNSVGHLSMGLACIDTLTRLSPSGCLSFCENSLVEKIYTILEESNRSLPWMDVCLRCTNILITLTKLPTTSHYTREIYYMETIARLLNATIKREHELFLHLATLLWLIAGDDNFAQEIIDNQRTIWLIKNICGTAIKYNNGKTNGQLTTCGGKRTMSVEKTILLPNTRPDWGFVTKRPRIFTTIHHAISALMAKFKITQGFQ